MKANLDKCHLSRSNKKVSKKRLVSKDLLRACAKSC